MGFLGKLFGTTPTPPDSARKLGRNKPCWCGSGKKYKTCHHDADQRHFAKQLPVCTSGS